MGSIESILLGACRKAVKRTLEEIIPVYLSTGERAVLVGEVPARTAQRAGCLVIWRGIKRDRPARAYATPEQLASLLSWLAGGRGTALHHWKTVYREWLPSAGRYIWSHKPLRVLLGEAG